MRRAVALVLVLSIVALGVRPAHAARTVGQIIDDAGITASVTAKLASERLSNLYKIDVKVYEGVVTLSGTVDTPERRERIGQLASWTNGVKGVVNNVQVSGTAPTPSQEPPRPQSNPNLSSTSPIDATGNVATVEPGTGTLTLADGRVVRVTDTTTIWQSGDLQALQPGAQVLIRNGSAAGLEGGAARSGDWRMGTVSRVDHIDNQVILTDGTIIKVTPSTVVHKGAEPLTFDKLEPGWEIVVKGPKAPVVDAAQIDVVWSPTANATSTPGSLSPTTEDSTRRAP
jgi:predicted amino acid-binding ACT domain protein